MGALTELEFCQPLHVCRAGHTPATAPRPEGSLSQRAWDGAPTKLSVSVNIHTNVSGGESESECEPESERAYG